MRAQAAPAFPAANDDGHRRRSVIMDVTGRQVVSVCPTFLEKSVDHAQSPLAVRAACTKRVWRRRRRCCRGLRSGNTGTNQGRHLERPASRAPHRRPQGGRSCSDGRGREKGREGLRSEATARRQQAVCPLDRRDGENETERGVIPGDCPPAERQRSQNAARRPDWPETGSAHLREALGALTPGERR
jgi:hypothetical protein